MFPDHVSVCSRFEAVQGLPQKSFCYFAGRRNVPGGGESQVDELIWGSDVDCSADPRIMEAKAQLFQGAAGTLPIRTEGRELWCCKRECESIQQIWADKVSLKGQNWQVLVLWEYVGIL